MIRNKILNLVASSFLFISFGVAAEECSLKYTMKGWSAFYKTYQGSGTVRCPSGKSARVKLSLKGGGFTLGASHILNGTGTIHGIHKIEDIYGRSFALGGHAGFTQSVEARWIPKGDYTITLSGKGVGYDLGWSVGSFRISKL